MSDNFCSAALPRPWRRGDGFALYQGDALEVGRRLADGAADCIVTSPPYFGLRDYGSACQYGQESSPAEYVERLAKLFSELRRVLADDGTLWLNIGDSYSAKRTYQVDQTKAQRSRIDHPYDTTKFLPSKNMLGIPWRVAFALQDDGWILRNDIIWWKRNAMPESVKDRLSNRYEHVFMFSKSRKYFFDLDPIREPSAAQRRPIADTEKKQVTPGASRHCGHRGAHAGGRNPGDVWDITTKSFRESHFAVFPPELPERCILAGCRPGGTVLDPFSGSGTTGMVALRHGRKYIGIELNEEYLQLSLRSRFAGGGENA